MKAVYSKPSVEVLYLSKQLNILQSASLDRFGVDEYEQPDTFEGVVDAQ